MENLLGDFSEPLLETFRNTLLENSVGDLFERPLLENSLTELFRRTLLDHCLGDLSWRAPLETSLGEHSSQTQENNILEKTAKDKTRKQNLFIPRLYEKHRTHETRRICFTIYIYIYRERERENVFFHPVAKLGSIAGQGRKVAQLRGGSGGGAICISL